ncbi:PLAT/LH2 domain-containing protein [Thaumasiovibrio subtropicus]|uniref:PLAT/LH2 domain-containing protein n=1 Tax=Thaumasiovibrio subtropicus TaxID=1891207 RepID=UPI000B34EA00|nr:PLAT/LH2 domain-containing protein [Thaumasiovibrio subtropicus]
MSESGWEIITITSGEKDSGSDADVSVCIGYNEDANFSNYVLLNPIKDTVHSNVFQRGNFDNFNLTFNVEDATVPTSIKVKVDGNDAWGGLRIYVMERSSGRTYTTAESRFFLEKGQTKVLPLIACIKDPGNVMDDRDPRAKDFTIGIGTASANHAGTNDLIYFKCISKDGISSELQQIQRIGDDWEPGQSNNYLMSFQRSLARIDYVILFKKANDNWLPNFVRMEPQLMDGKFQPTVANNLQNVWLDGDTVGQQNYLEMATVVDETRIAELQQADEVSGE